MIDIGCLVFIIALVFFLIVIGWDYLKGRHRKWFKKKVANTNSVAE